MLPVKPLGWGTTLSKTHDMPKKTRPAREKPSPGPTPSVNAPVACGMAWAAQLHAVMQHHAWAAAVQTPGVAGGEFAAHQALLVALRAQQAGATGGGAAVASDGNRAVAAVASSIVMDSNVFPNRNSTRDKETTKEVVDAINKYDLIPTVGQAEVWKGNYFLEFKVDCLRATLESTERHGQDSLVESIHFP